MPRPPRLFPGQQPDEQIISVFQRHWFVFVGHAFLILLAAAVPLVIGAWLGGFLNWSLQPDSLGYVLLVMAGALYYLFLWTVLYGFWLDHILDYYIVSDKRVVDVEQAGVFHRTVAEQPLENVQDVTSEVSGVWATVLKYGNVYIQSAGQKERFVFEHVPNPEAVARLILSHVDKNNRRPEVPTAADPVSAGKPGESRPASEVPSPPRLQ